MIGRQRRESERFLHCKDGPIFQSSFHSEFQIRIEGLDGGKLYQGRGIEAFQNEFQFWQKFFALFELKQTSLNFDLPSKGLEAGEAELVRSSNI